MIPRAPVLATCMLVASACNLVELSDDISQAQCRSDDDCEVLNARDDEAFDPCIVWQCEASRYCEEGPLDADHDGFSPASADHGGETFMCLDDASEADCTDSDPDNAPDLDETCDDRDNDCDGHADEGALASEVGTLVALPDGAPDAASYALDAAGGALAVAFAWERASGSVPTLAVVGDALTDTASPSALESDALGTPRATRVAAAVLEPGRFAVAFSQEGAAARVVAGAVDADAPAALALDAELAANGLACAAAEPCAGGAGGASAGIGLATVGEYVLVAHARPAQGDPACGELVGSDAAPRVLANLLLAPRNAPTLVERTTEALVLGTTSAPEIDPVVVGLEPLAESGAALGWLVGYVDADGGIVLHQVLRDGDALDVVEAPVLAIAGDGIASEPAAALAVADDGDAKLGLAFRRGCPDDARIVTRIFVLTIASDGRTLTATPLGGETEVGATRSESSPAIAYHATRVSWIVSWRDAAGLRARVLDENGGLRGAEPYTLVEQGAGLGVLLSTGAVSTGSAFGVLAAVSRGGGAFEFDAIRLDCEP